jgi:hypothetical protein
MHLCLALGLILLAGCSLLYECGLAGSTSTVYTGQLGGGSAIPSATESDTGVVTITLIEEDGGGYAEAMFTLAKPGLRQFGDSMFVRDRSTGEVLAATGYGDYRSDSLVFRANAFRQKDGWKALTSAINSGRAHFELRSLAGVDTAALRLTYWHHSKGVCT